MNFVHGEDTAPLMRCWRWVFLVTSGLFGYDGDSGCGVSHHRTKAAWIRFAPIGACSLHVGRAVEQAAAH